MVWLSYYMKTLKAALALGVSLLLTGNLAQAQESAACANLEREGIARFKQLEKLANDLRGHEQLLRERRVALQSQRSQLEANRKPDPAAATQLNEAVKVFNQQADQLNTDKAKFEQDTAAYEQWMASSLQPACAPK